MKLYKFTRIITKEYQFDIEAETFDEAFDIFKEKTIEEADGERLLDDYSSNPIGQEIEELNGEPLDSELNN